MLVSNSTAFAQQALEPSELSASGEAYTAAIRFRGIDADVVYFDPTLQPPEFKTPWWPETDASPDFAEGGSELITVSDDSISVIRGVLTIVAVIVLTTILYVAVAYGGGLRASFKREPDEARDTKGKQPANGDPATPVALGLDAIVNMADRQRALIALCRALLAQVVTAQGVLLQRSWTDRDTLQKIPKDFAHRDALTALVLDCERAQFGGRAVSEETFSAHLERLHPLITSRTA